MTLPRYQLLTYWRSQCLNCFLYCFLKLTDLYFLWIDIFSKFSKLISWEHFYGHWILISKSLQFQLLFLVIEQFRYEMWSKITNWMQSILFVIFFSERDVAYDFVFYKQTYSYWKYHTKCLIECNIFDGAKSL